MRLLYLLLLACILSLLAGCGGPTGLPLTPGGGGDDPPVGPPPTNPDAALATFHALPRLRPLASRTATLATIGRDWKPYEYGTALAGFDGPAFGWGGWVPYWDEMMAATRGEATLMRTLHGVTLTLTLADTTTHGRYAAALTARGTDIYTGVSFDGRTLVRAEAGAGPATFAVPGRDWPTIAVAADGASTADATHRIDLTATDAALTRLADGAVLLTATASRTVLHDPVTGDPASGEAIRLETDAQGLDWFSQYQPALHKWSKPVQLTW